MGSSLCRVRPPEASAEVELRMLRMDQGDGGAAFVAVAVARHQSGPSNGDTRVRGLLEGAPDAMVLVSRRHHHRRESPDGEAVRLRADRADRATDRDPGARSGSGRATGSPVGVLRGPAHPTDGSGPRPVRPPQGRQRVPGRDQPRSGRHRGRDVRHRGHPRHHRAAQGRGEVPRVPRSGARRRGHRERRRARSSSSTRQTEKLFGYARDGAARPARRDPGARRGSAASTPATARGYFADPEDARDGHRGSSCSGCARTAPSSRSRSA